MPRLKSLKVGFAGFDKFPSDLESLNCITEAEFGAYMFGIIDLSTIDLTRFRCLKKAVFHTWYESMKGIPKGLDDTTRVIDLDVHHKYLTQKEKILIKNYTRRLKSIGPNQ